MVDCVGGVGAATLVGRHNWCEVGGWNNWLNTIVKGPVPSM